MGSDYDHEEHKLIEATKKSRDLKEYNERAEELLRHRLDKKHKSDSEFQRRSKMSHEEMTREWKTETAKHLKHDADIRGEKTTLEAQERRLERIANRVDNEK